MIDLYPKSQNISTFLINFDIFNLLIDNFDLLIDHFQSIKRSKLHQNLLNLIKNRSKLCQNWDRRLDGDLGIRFGSNLPSEFESLMI